MDIEKEREEFEIETGKEVICSNGVVVAFQGIPKSPYEEECASYTRGLWAGWKARAEKAHQEIQLLKNDLVAEQFKTKLFADEVQKLKSSKMTEERATEIAKTLKGAIHNQHYTFAPFSGMEESLSSDQLKALVFLMENKKD